MELLATQLRSNHEPWRILVFSHSVSFDPYDDNSRIVVRHEDLATRIGPFPAGQGQLLLTLLTEKITLRLNITAASALRRNLGPHLAQWGTALAMRETKTALLVGAGFSVAAYVMGSPFLTVLAVAYLVAGIGRMIRGGRWLFLLAALRALALVIIVALEIILLGTPWWTGFVAVFFLLGASMQFRRFVFFGSPG